MSRPSRLRPPLARLPRRRGLDRIRPRLERLESRVVLSTATWEGDLGTDWYNAGNWLGDYAPRPGDDVILAGSAPAHFSGEQAIGSLSGTAPLYLGGGTLTVGAGSTFDGTLDIHATLVLNADLAASGTTNLTGGSVKGPGTLTTNAQLNIGNSNLGTTLIANGDTTWVGLNTIDAYTGPATFINHGTFDISNGWLLNGNWGYPGKFINASDGVILKDSPGVNPLTWEMVNHGKIRVLQGEITLEGRGTAVSDGTIEGAAGTRITLSNYADVSGPVSGGYVGIQAALVTGSVTADTLYVYQSTLTGDVGPVNSLTVQGIVDFSPVSGPTTLHLNEFRLIDGGTLRGTTGYTVDGPATFRNASYTATGTLTTNGPLTIGNCNLSGTLIANGYTSWVGLNTIDAYYGPATFINHGTFDISNGWYLNGNWGYPGKFINETDGIILKDSPGLNPLGWEMVNHGKIQVLQGEITLEGRGTAVSDGTIEASSGTRVTLSNYADVSGPITSGGYVGIQAALVTGTVTADSMYVYQSTLTGDVGPIGSLTVQGIVDFSPTSGPTTLHLNEFRLIDGGTLRGTTGYEVNGPATFRNASYTATGTLTTNGPLTIGNCNLSGTLIANGYTSWVGLNTIDAYTGPATFINHGTFDISNGWLLNGNWGYPGKFINASDGVILKDSPGVNPLTWEMVNHGKIRVLQGEITLEGRGTAVSDGTIEGAAGTRITLSNYADVSGPVSGGYVGIQAALVTGSVTADTLYVYQSTLTGDVGPVNSLTVQGIVDFSPVSGPTTLHLNEFRLIDGGTLRGTTGYTVDGPATFRNASYTATGTLTTNGPLTIGNCNLSGTLIANGYTSWVGLNTIDAYYGPATFINHGTFDISNGWYLNGNWGFPGKFINETDGIILKDSPGLNPLGWEMVNHGKIQVLQGEITLEGRGTAVSDGTIEGAAGTRITLSNYAEVSGPVVSLGYVGIQAALVSGTVTADTLYVYQSTITGDVGPIGSLTVQGIVDFSPTSGPTTLHLNEFRLIDGGTLRGTTGYEVNGPAVFRNASYTATGTLTTNGPLTIGNVNLSSTLITHGRTTWAGLNTIDAYYGPATIINHGVFDVSQGWYLNGNWGFPASFLNEIDGVIYKGDTTTVTLGWTLTNRGEVSVANGTLNLTGRGTGTSDGPIHAAPGTTVGLSQFASISGPLFVYGLNVTNSAVSGTVFAGPTYAYETTFNLTDGRFGELLIDGNVEFRHVGTPTPIQIASLTLNNGDVLKAADDLLVTQSFAFNGGVLRGLDGKGSLKTLGQFTLNGEDYVDNVTLLNGGQGVWSGGRIHFLGDTRFVNLAGATFDDRVDGTFGLDGAGSSIFENQGLFIKSGGDGVTHLLMQLINSGEVRIDRGILDLGGGYLEVIPPGGGGGGTIGGGGGYTGDRNVDNGGNFSSGGGGSNTQTVSNFIQRATGTFIEQIGGSPGPFGQLIVTGSVILDGTLRVGLFNGYVPRLGDSFRIIDNQGTSPVFGRFANADELGVVMAGAYGFRVTYKGGTGNDIVLTVITTNQAPTAVAGGPYSVPRGGSVQLDGSGSLDPDQDLATLTYAWDLDGDGVFGETGAGATRGDETGLRPSFSAAGLNAPTTRTIQLRVTDASGASSTASALVQVFKVAPTFVIDGAPGSSPESASIALTVSAAGLTPADLAVYNFTWHVSSTNGQVIADGLGLAFTFIPTDDGTYTVTLTGKDAENFGASASTTILVTDVAPTLTLSGPTDALAGQSRTFSLAISDPSPVDLAGGYTYRIDWDADGTFDQIVTGGAGLTVDHAFAAAGDYTIYVNAVDHNGVASLALLDISIGWTQSFGGIERHTDIITGTAIDAQGRTYAVGYTSRPLPGQPFLGGQDAFLRRYRANGTVEWTKAFGSGGNDKAYSIAIGPDGAIYMAGETDGALPGQSLPGFSDAFLARFTADGDVTWIREFGSYSPTPVQFAGIDRATGVVADSTGIYIVGTVTQTLPGRVRPPSSVGHAFIRKYSAAGDEAWTDQLHTYSSTPTGVATNGQGHVYLVGVTNWSTLTEPSTPGYVGGFFRDYNSDGSIAGKDQFGSNLYGVAADASGIYIAAYDSALVVKKISSTYQPLWKTVLVAGAPSAMTLDGAGSLYLAGISGGAMSLSKYQASNGAAIWDRTYAEPNSVNRVGAVAATPTSVLIAGSAGYNIAGGTGSNGYEDAFIRQYQSSGVEGWTNRFSEQIPSAEYGQSVAVDASGYVYVAGTTTGVLRGQISAGNNDAFLAKYNPSGTLLWVRQFGSSDHDSAYSVVVDASGAIYVAGHAGANIPGATGLFYGGAFLRKFDPLGRTVWTQQFGASQDDAARGVAVDSTGMVYVVGTTKGVIAGQTSPGGPDAFLAKFDTVGNASWTRQFGSPGADTGLAVAVDPSGAIYAGGYAIGTLPGQPAGQGSLFVVKYLADGGRAWTKQFGGADFGLVYGLAADSGGVYAVGTTSGAIVSTSDPGTGHAFIRRLRSGDGAEVWTRQFGAGSSDTAFSVAADPSGVYISGVTDGALPGQVSTGSTNNFLRKYDLAGNVAWTRQFDATSGWGNGLALDSTGGVYVTSNRLVPLLDYSLFTDYDVTLARFRVLEKDAAVAVAPNSSITINGTSGNDTIVIDVGIGGNDLVVTVNGALFGTYSVYGTVKVLAGWGDDTIIVNAFAGRSFTLDGQEGSDTYQINLANNRGSVAIADTGIVGNDRLAVVATAQDDYIDKRNNTIKWWNRAISPGTNLLTPPTPLVTITSSGIDRASISLGAGNDYVLDPSEDTELIGGEGDDTFEITGTAGNGVAIVDDQGLTSVIVHLGQLAGPVNVNVPASAGASIQVVGTDGDDRIRVSAAGLTTSTGEVINVAGLVRDVAVDVGQGGGLVTFVDLGSSPVAYDVTSPPQASSPQVQVVGTPPPTLALNGNQAPIVSLVSPATGIEGSSLAPLNASASYDPDGDPLSYAWSVFKNGSTIAFVTGSGPAFAFVPDDKRLVSRRGRGGPTAMSGPRDVREDGLGRERRPLGPRSPARPPASKAWPGTSRRPPCATPAPRISPG